jgi:hypothetical protein
VRYSNDGRCSPSFIVHSIPKARGVDDVQSQADIVLLYDVRDCVNLCRLPDWVVMLVSSFRVQQVRGKDGVDEGRLAEAALADDHEVELEPAFEEFVLDLLMLSRV